MSTFNIDEEIDRIVEKFAEQCKARLKKVVERSEKIILKQYIASQKETARATKTSSQARPSNTMRGDVQTTKPKIARKKVPVNKAGLKREAEYFASSDDSFSDSE